MEELFQAVVFRFARKELVKYINKHIDQKHIMPLYEEAHAEYRRRTSLGSSWMKIHEDLEVSLEIPTRFCESTPKIAIRTHSEKVFETVELLVDAEGVFDGIQKYNTVEERLIFRDVGFNSRCSPLSVVPPIDCWALENGNLIFSYQALSITIVSLCRDGNTEAIQQRITPILLCRSNYLDDLLKGNWQKKFGKTYNIGDINEAKEKLRRKIHSDLNPPPNWVTNEEYLQNSLILRKYWKISSFFNEVRCNLLLQNRILSARFWVLVALGRLSEDQYGRLKFDKYSLF
ncbi:hypothetical protein S7335_2900 [Synechococcus sp. PCC 7335]|uniref:hypothetical protein n=1 Tax=Synechococcus sp. (strain ATCC 29403 / PCC 7335) TaxID=91464 RepID=UPI00017EC03A|nr:hypothetical protein [Synechococcus sp. PCC 7335]EDX85201.1 hypothetical protein S7335_2900 [Synechococcus sp. PCC 7335]